MFSEKDIQFLTLAMFLGPFAIPVFAMKQGWRAVQPKKEVVVKQPKKSPLQYVTYPVREFFKNQSAKKMIEKGGLTVQQKDRLAEIIRTKATQLNLVYIFVKAINFDKENTKNEETIMIGGIRQTSSVHYKLFDKQNMPKEETLMVGGFWKSDQVKMLLKIVKRKFSYLKDQSVQFFCNKKMLSLNTSLGSLPINQDGYVEIYLMNMETFG